MPTVKEVDNRPVAVGKWPRHHSHLHNHPMGVGRLGQRHQHHRHKCNVDDHFIQNHNNSCIDVLLNPELLNQLHGDPNFLSSSSNPLLEFCLDGGNVKAFNDNDFEPYDPLLQACMDFNESPTTTDLKGMLQHLGQIGCDINVRNAKGNTALHLLIKGCTKDNFKDVLESTGILVSMGLDTSIQNIDGDDCLGSLSHLLKKRLFNESFDLASILLDKPTCNPNRLNKAGRSLLSYSVAHGDESVELTRLLLNHGAKVWPNSHPRASTVQEMIQEREASAFTHFLYSAIQKQEITMFTETLRLICDDMGTEPELMRTHVLSTMLHVAQTFNGATNLSIANLYLQLKSFVSHYWRQPSSLKYLCVHTIRRSLGPNNILNGAQHLNIPPSLISSIHLK